MKFLYLFLKVDFISNPRDNSANLFNCLIIAESTCYDYIYLLNLTTLHSVAILDAPCDITRQLTLVVVLQTTVGWRKAPALAQRVCTQGLASPSSILLKNTMNTARFRVVRAAGA